MLNRIVASTKEETWFVYMNPKYANKFIPEKFESVFEFKTKRYLEAVIYKLKLSDYSRFNSILKVGPLFISLLRT